MKSLTFLAAFLMVSATYAPAQSQLVRLNVVALDKQGQPVTDLKAEDLQVLDDGKPQPIVLFHANDSRHPAPAALGPHEYSNRAPGTPNSATVILFDLLNGSFADREYMVLTIVKALSNVESPGNVYLYLLTNSGTLFPIHPLPGHEASPEAAAPDQNWTSQAKPLLDAAIQKVYGIRPRDDQDVGIRAVTTFNVLRDLGGELAAVPGRKDIVWITNAFPLQIRYGGLCRDIKVWNVTAPCTGEYVDFKPLVRYVGEQLDSVGVSLYSVDEWNVDGGDRVLVKATLDEFASMTAGKSYVSGGTKNAIPDAVQGVRWSYTIGFSPKNWDGKFHKLRVTSTRKGIQLQSEQGYVATAPVDETAALLQAGAAATSDLAAIGLRATVTSGASPNTVRIQLRIDPSSLAIVQQNGRYSGQLATLYDGVATDGLKQLAKPSSLTFDWTAQQYEDVSKDGLAVSGELPVPAGVHQVRIVVVDTKANQVGTLTVPVS
jgi:VWFA-related protein